MNRRNVLGLAGAMALGFAGRVGATDATPPACGTLTPPIKLHGDASGTVTDPFLLPAGSYRVTVTQSLGSTGTLFELSAVPNDAPLTSAYIGKENNFRKTSLLVVEHDRRVTVAVESDGIWAVTLQSLA